MTLAAGSKLGLGLLAARFAGRPTREGNFAPAPSPGKRVLR